MSAAGPGGDDLLPARVPLQFHADSDPLYTVGQAADLLGVPAAFLRRLEAHDAVRPSRTAGGQRRYSRIEVEHIDALNGLMADGITLAGAMRIIALQTEVADLRRRIAVLEAGDAT